MNSDSSESFQGEENTAVPSRQPEPGRSRFTLLSDQPEPTAPNKTNDQDSPVRMYLRDLHEQREQRLLLQKENSNKDGNRKERTLQGRAQKDKINSFHNEQTKRSVLNQFAEGRDNNTVNRSRRTCFEKNCEPENRMKPGIYLYRKKINLAEPAESWSDLSDSYLRGSFDSRKHFGGDFNTTNNSEKLFEEALRHRCPRR